MRDRFHTLLTLRILFLVLIVGFSVAPLFSLESAQTVIISVNAKVNAADLCARYGVTLLDSIPELNEYLVNGDTVNLSKLRKDSGVASMSNDVAVEISEKAMLNESTVALLDPSTVALLDGDGKLWDPQNPVQSSILQQPALKKIGLDPMNPRADAPITVAVIDTGVDPFHEMLLGSTLPGRNFIDDQRSTDELLDLDPATAALLLQAGGRTGRNDVVAVVNESTVALLDPSVIELLNNQPSPYFGHGTLVSSLIHAIAPAALIMPLKVFDVSGRGSSFRIAKAIVYATAQGARIINMSFSLESASGLVDEALHYAADRNIVLVASIGNQNSKVDKNYPSSYNKVIGVAATDPNDRKAGFSNYGPAANVSAPGVALISAYPAGLYAAWSGTSAAAALVSGEAAFLLSRKQMSADQTTTRIQDKVDLLNDPAYQLGKGRINLKSASADFDVPPQTYSMEGHLKITAGDWISGGYSFKLTDGGHIATSVSVTSRVSLVVGCPYGGGPGGTLQVDLGTRTYAVPAGNTNWLPTDDANSILSWMGSTQAPDLCGGYPMDNSKGASITFTVSKSPATASPVDFRFKYRDPNAKGKGNVNCLSASDPRRSLADVCGAGWSPTMSVP